MCSRACIFTGRSHGTRMRMRCDAFDRLREMTPVQSNAHGRSSDQTSGRSRYQFASEEAVHQVFPRRTHLAYMQDRTWQPRSKAAKRRRRATVSVPRRTGSVAERQQSRPALI